MLTFKLRHYLDNPKQFLNTLSSVTTKLLILQTHFSTDVDGSIHNLSQITENEGLLGRWYTEFATEETFDNREAHKWRSWDNRRSFWIQREFLIQAIYDAGFDIVMEQYEHFAPNIKESMLSGDYKIHDRGTFIGVKTPKATESM